VVGLIERDIHGVRVFSFESFGACAGVDALVTTRHGGESTGPFATLNLGMRTGDDAETVRRNRARAASVVGAAPAWLTFGRQVHGARVAVVRNADRGAVFDDTDALVTNASLVPLVILTADCAAVFYVDPVHRAVGIAHAGWRGAVARIAARTLDAMHDAFGTAPGDVAAAVGPSIGPCCYEVGSDVIDGVAAAFPDHADELLIEPDMASAGSFRASVNEDKKHFDLWRANELALQHAGVRDDRIEVSRLCTACRTDLFYSHRAEKGNTGRFGGIVMLHEPVLESRSD
jgi:YfiH family protein